MAADCACLRQIPNNGVNRPSVRAGSEMVAIDCREQWFWTPTHLEEP